MIVPRNLLFRQEILHDPELGIGGRPGVSDRLAVGMEGQIEVALQIEIDFDGSLIRIRRGVIEELILRARFIACLIQSGSKDEPLSLRRPKKDAIARREKEGYAIF